MKPPPLGLYIHLPWCERKCPYCDFNSHETETLPEASYIEALLLDLSHDASLVQGREIESIFIGGGTPSLFTAGSIDKLLQGVHELVDVRAGAEISMEANPGSAEAIKFAGFRAAGVNRLSLGIQSFDDECLAALGRVHNSKQAQSAIDYAHAAGFDNINLDLMHGLPGQSLHAARRDLEIALASGPTHLSWYQLTIEPNTVFYSKPPTLPVENELAEIQCAGETVLHAKGFRQYEVSAYCVAERQCRHNHNYWTFGDYLGIGAGAHAKLTFEKDSIRRFSKRKLPEKYLQAQAGEHTSENRQLLSGDLPGEFVMNALRLNEGFSMELFTARTGLPGSAVGPEIQSLENRGLLSFDGKYVAATDTGRRFLDSVVAEFL